MAAGNGNFERGPGAREAMQLQLTAKIIIWGGLLALFGSAFAREEDATPQSDFDIDDVYDFKYKGVTPEKFAVPPIPDDSAFVSIDLDHAPPGLKVAIDVSGILTDSPNSSTHFWMRLTSDQGGYNLSYEGYRCSAHRFRVHAWGFRGETPDIRLNSAAKWQKVLVVAGSQFRRELDDFYLCREGRPLSPKEVLNRVNNKTITDFDSNY